MTPPPNGPPAGALPIPPNIPPQPKVAPEALALRAKPRPVTRLSRRALILLGSVSALIVGGLAIWALGVQHGGGTPPQELYSTDRKPIAEGLRNLPGNYGSLPKPALPAGAPPLGPPLPGDLGRPFLRAQQEQGAPVTATTTPAGPTAAEQAEAAERDRLRQEAEAARRGALFVQVRQRSVDQPAPESTVAGSTTPPNPFAPLPGSAESARPDEAVTQNGQDRKSAFLNAATDAKIYASGRLQTPASPFQVMAGTIIPAAMVTGLNSDLPGQAIATVTEPVYDTVTGKTLLIPQGSRLLGTYDAHVSYGQSRVLLVWTRLIMTVMVVVHIDPTAAFECPPQPPLSKRCNDRLNLPWLPRSEWWMRPPLRVGRRLCKACSNASRTKPAWAVRLTRQPMIRRANASMTNAT